MFVWAVSPTRTGDHGERQPVTAIVCSVQLPFHRQEDRPLVAARMRECNVDLGPAGHDLPRESCYGR